MIIDKRQDREKRLAWLIVPETEEERVLLGSLMAFLKRVQGIYTDHTSIMRLIEENDRLRADLAEKTFS